MTFIWGENAYIFSCAHLKIVHSFITQLQAFLPLITWIMCCFYDSMNRPVDWMHAFTQRHLQNNKSNLYWCSATILIKYNQRIRWHCIVMLHTNGDASGLKGVPIGSSHSGLRYAHLFWLNTRNHFNRLLNLFPIFPIQRSRNAKINRWTWDFGKG